MTAKLPSARSALPAASLPSEIYIPLVDSLYRDGRTLLTGTFFVVGSILTTYWKTGEPLLFACAVAVIVVACVRGCIMRAYRLAKSSVLSNGAARRWERRYVAGAAASVGLLGVWCYIAFARTSDPFAHLVSFTMTIAYVIGIFGRNFGNSRFVIVQILCASVPITAALLLHGDIYHWIFAGLLIPFFLAVKFIAERLRDTLLEAVVASRDMSLLAKRFDTALNNMPHGLCMFDTEQRIVVANGRLSAHLGLLPNLELKGMSPAELVAAAVDGGLIANADAARVVDELGARLSGVESSDFHIETERERTLEFKVQPMERGGMVLLIEDITERKIAQARINHLARFDSLTGLPNRNILRANMEAALATCSAANICAVHFIDLDQFKQVNDTLGHSRGDILLIAVAGRLQRVVRSTDTIARFGGDEFVVLQYPVRSTDEVSELAKRIVERLKGTYDIDGHEVAVSASVGIAIAEENINPDQLLRNADMALYRTKAESRGTWRWFEAEMEVQAQARRSLELDLRNALENDAFDLHYQPIFDLRSRRIVSCEALLRWRHRERGMVSPGEFIPVAEEMGIIVEIGQQALRKACLECRQWPGDTGVAVNFSPIQFSRSNVPALIRQTLAATHLPAERLQIEITESTLLQDTEKTRAALRQLEKLGVKVSLDDFGTGYSSLSYLHSFPLHKVKIDQSFIQDLANNRRMTLLHGVAQLSVELGLRVTVEGVETEEQLSLIAAEGSVDEAQGYLLGRPVPASEIRKLLLATTPTTAPLVQVA